jgi:hypothetical protein
MNFITFSPHMMILDIIPAPAWAPQMSFIRFQYALTDYLGVYTMHMAHGDHDSEPFSPGVGRPWTHIMTFLSTAVVRI